MGLSKVSGSGIDVNVIIPANLHSSFVLPVSKLASGAGSGLDADKLDGQHGSYYLDYNNLTNVPTISTDASTLGGVGPGGFLRSNVADTKTVGNLKFNDNIKLTFGNQNDFRIYHNGTNTILENATGSVFLQAIPGEDSIVAVKNGSVSLFYDNAKKLETNNTGVTVTGTLTATGFSGAGGSLTGVNASQLNSQNAGYYLNYNNFTNTPSLSMVATSGSYIDLSDKPTIPTNNNQLTNGAGYTTHPNPAITSNGSTPSLNSGISAGEIRSLIGAGTSSFNGAYSSLTGKPTIPTNNNQLTNGAGYLSSVPNHSAGLLTSGTIPDARISDIGNSQARIITFDNLEKSDFSADGQLGFDSSQGLLVYRTQQGTSGATTTVLDGFNINAGEGISISNQEAGGTSTEQFTFSVSNIPASRITSGTLSPNRLPNHSAALLTSGTLPAARLPNHSADLITSGTIAEAHLPDHSAGLITSGTLSDARIPDTITPVTRVTTKEIRTSNGTELVLNAGESAGKISGQTGELVYINAEGGLRVSTPSSMNSNWQGGTASDATNITGTSINIGGNISFHGGNDGSGSGLDADLLDGQQGSYYSNYNNLSNKPSIPTNNNQLTNGAGYLTSVPNHSAALLTSGTLPAARLPNHSAGLLTSGTIPAARLPGTRSSNLTISKSLPKLILDSPSSGDAFTSQGAQISLGESGDGGSAALHLTYRGDGYAYIGMGTLPSNGIPPYSQIRFKYNSNQIRFNSTPDVSGSAVWHAGNDGSGSGLDADTVDGLQASSFLRSDANDSTSGQLTVSGNLLVGDQVRIGDDAWIEDFNVANTIRIKGNQNSNQGYIAFGNRTEKLGCNNSATLQYNGNTVWHAGNDGSGSGLNADLLDGQTGAYYRNASNIDAGTFPDRFSNSTRYNIGYIDGVGSNSYDKIRVWDSSSYSMGMHSAMTFGWLNDYAMTFTMNNDSDRGFLWRDTSDAQSDGAMSLTTNGNLCVKNVIAVGGQTSRYLGQPSGNYGSIQINGGGNGNWEGFSIDGRMVFMHDGGDGVGIYNDVDNEWMFYGVRNSYTRMYHNGSTCIQTVNSSTATIGGNSIWHTGNDGSGSGMDADTLDGVNSGSFLRSDQNDSASGTITFNGRVNIRGHIDLADNEYLYLGSGDDVELFCNGSHLYMDLNSGIGNFYIRDGSTTRYTFDDNGSFTATGNVTAYSDIKLKDNIKIIDNPIDKVQQINGVTFDRIDEPELGRQLGVIAQDVEKVCPELVNTDEEGIKSVAYGHMTGLLIEAIKEQQKQIDDLRNEIKTLKGKN